MFLPTSARWFSRERKHRKTALAQGLASRRPDTNSEAGHKDGESAWWRQAFELATGFCQTAAVAQTFREEGGEAVDG